MRFSRFTLPLALFGVVSAQYSAGWAPGQPVEQPYAGEWAPGQAAPDDARQPVQAAPFDISQFFTSGPLASLLLKAGVNLTKNLEEAAEREDKRWDKRIPLITDDNYESLIVNETLTEEEEKDRVWMIVITTAKGPTGAFSELVDKSFDEAYELAVTENILPNVRWGRVDYLAVTALTTKWVVWRGPQIVVLTDRGQTLRFYKPNQYRVSAELIRDFLKDEEWRYLEPWKTAWSPGGSNEWMLNWFSFIMSKYYNGISTVPKWLLIILTGSFGTMFVNLFHTSKPAAPQRRVVKNTPSGSPAAAPKVAAASTPVSPSPSKSKAKGRKGKK